MPKMKTHKGSAKRFRRTGTGKIMRAKAFKSHISKDFDLSCFIFFFQSDIWIIKITD